MAEKIIEFDPTPADAFRFALMLVIVFGVYTETGIWTALAIGLILFGIEMLSFSVRRISRHLSS